MTRFDKVIVGIIASLLLVVFSIQLGMYQGRILEREEIKREDEAIIKFLQDRIKKLQLEVTEKEKLLQKKKGVFVATAYCNSPICINVPQYQDGLTASGTVARLGVVAVDPSVIPLGKDIYVEGYGWFRAEDTGGKIKGKKIDIFLGDYRRAKEFGRKQVIVYY